MDKATRGSAAKPQRTSVGRSAVRLLGKALLVAFSAAAVYFAVRGIITIGSHITLTLVLHVIGLGFITLGRVLTVVALATLIWTPVGVRIGLSPKLAKVAQPLVQIGASFPANLVFPLVVLTFVRLHIHLNWGSILLLMLGTQWYILFNVIAGAMSVPGDLREAAMVFNLRGWHMWRTLILPAIFPAWVTGALTAAGGAWNASIVAEVADWGQNHLVAKGLGAYLAESTRTGDWPAIIVSIATMSAFVVALNRCLWKPLYAIADERYRLG